MNRPDGFRANLPAPSIARLGEMPSLPGGAISQEFESRFAVALERRGERTLVRVTGDLDLETSPQLERALSAVQAPGRHVVLDLRDLRAADDTGMRAILHALDTADDIGAELRVIPGELARRMFKSAGFGERLDAFSIEADG